MDDLNSPEQQITTEILSTSSWKEIRDKYQNSHYSQIYESIMRLFKVWESSPRVAVDEDQWNRDIETQMEKAKGLVMAHSPLAKMIDVEEGGVDKIAANGNEVPSFGKENATRIYIGVDPRYATDAFQALLYQLEANGVLKDIQAALNIEELREKKLAGNMLIIYEPKSRPEVLGKVLEAYQGARLKHPELFNLLDRQKAFVMRDNLRHFHALIDENMSFVEAPAVREGKSFDTIDAPEIKKAFSIGQGTEAYNDEQWLSQVKKIELGVVFEYADQRKIDNSLTKAGDTMHYYRKLSAPALVQYGTITAR